MDSPSRNPPPPSGDFMVTPPSDGDLALLLANPETIRGGALFLHEKFKISKVQNLRPVVYLSPLVDLREGHHVTMDPHQGALQRKIVKICYNINQ